MPRLPCLVAVLFLAAPALAEEAGRARDLARAALFDGATVPAAAEMPVAGAGDTAGAHLTRQGRIDAEHEAHVRAAEHGARHSREARPAHGGDGASGAMHGGAGGSGMEGGADCHDAAGNRRTRGMHDGGGEMDPRHPGMGMKTAPLSDPGGARGVTR